MQNITNKEKKLLCPSARAESDNSVVFGVIAGTADEPQVHYFNQSQPVTEETFSVASPVTPTEIFRISANCAEKDCQHFNGYNCQLIERIVEHLPEVTETLPPCSIRRDCRWWQQEGKSACMRCPQVVTDHYNSSQLARQVAKPIKKEIYNET